MTNHFRSLTVRRVLPLAAIAAVLSATPLLASRALHNHLGRSEPAKDSTVTTAPAEIKLYFAEAVKPAVAGVKLMASDSSVVATGTLTLGTGKNAPLIAPVKGALKAGVYRVMWHVAGDDGHPVAGDFKFTFKPAAK